MNYWLDWLMWLWTILAWPWILYNMAMLVWSLWRRVFPNFPRPRLARSTWPVLTGTQIDMTDGEEFDFLLRENWAPVDRLLPLPFQFAPMPVYVKRTSPTTVTLGFVPWPHLYSMRWPVAGGKALP